MNKRNSPNTKVYNILSVKEGMLILILALIAATLGLSGGTPAQADPTSTNFTSIDVTLGAIGSSATIIVETVNLDAGADSVQINVQHPVTLTVTAPACAGIFAGGTVIHPVNVAGGTAFGCYLIAADVSDITGPVMTFELTRAQDFTANQIVTLKVSAGDGTNYSDGGTSIGPGTTNTLTVQAGVTTGHISGTVTDAVSIGAINGADVTASGTSGEGTFNTTTDTNGDYSLADLPPGTYDVTASAPGFNSQTALGVSVTAGATTTLDFGLQPGNTPPVAQDDAFTTDKDTPLNGNVFADNGDGADSDADGDILTVRTVNGDENSVGVQITLPSGALLALNGDGSFSYDPTGQFDALQTGQQAFDGFTYTVTDGTDNSNLATVTITIQVGSEFSAELSLALHQDIDDGATGMTIHVTKTFNTATGEEVPIQLGGFEINLNYDSSCLDVLEVRQMDFPNINATINGTGVATFEGSTVEGIEAPVALGHSLTRLKGNAGQNCTVTIEVMYINDLAGNRLGVSPATPSLDFLRGDARADGIINIADSLFIAQHLVGLRNGCTTVIDSNCLHSVNAASVRQDGVFDVKTIADALFIAQHLVELRDAFYGLLP